MTIYNQANTLLPIVVKNAKRLLNTVLMSALVVVATGVEVSITSSQQAFAQEQSQRKTKRVESIRQKHIKTFEKISEAFDAEDYPTVLRFLDKLNREDDLNNIEKAYVANFRGNIYFSQDNLNGALREFKKVTATRDGIPDGFYNQILYVIAQVLFSQEKYREALKYAETWFKTQEDPSADAYMLVGQAHYLLKDYNKALPNVQKGINKYEELGSVPKEGWLNLLSSIYRQKNQFRKMLPVLKKLVKHYPKKTYLLTMGGIYNELDDQPRMTAMYQALYDQNLLSSESEFVTLASLHLSQDNPYKAATIMQKGIDSGVAKKTLRNYRLYSQALFLAKEYQKALDPLAKAAAKAKDGKLYNQLGQSYIALNRWKQAEGALNKALNKGKLTNTGQTIISLGLVQFEQKKYKSAKATFNRAIQYKKVASDASNWVKYVNNEEFRLAELAKPIVISTKVEPKST